MHICSRQKASMLHTVHEEMYLAFSTPAVSAYRTELPVKCSETFCSKYPPCWTFLDLATCADLYI